MKICFELAQQGIGHVAPNPLVGSILVKNHQIIAEGFHQKVGENHAEKNCIENLELSQTENSILFCNLEPCSHTNKRTPPCTELIIRKKIPHVIISNIDPNPLVSGAGIKKLQDHGIKVEVGISQEIGLKLNEIFFYHIHHQLPFITLKWAQSLDGKLALNNGQSQWISNQKSRTKLTDLRLEHDGILIGAGTLINDNPSLLPRDNNQNILMRKKRFVLCSNKIEFSQYQIFNDQYAQDTYLICPKDIAEKISYPHHQIINYDAKKSFTENIPEILKKIYLKGCYSLLIEGGANTLTSFYQNHCYQKLCLFIAPVILGQGKAINESVILENLPKIKHRYHLECQAFDDNVLLTYRWNKG